MKNRIYSFLSSSFVALCLLFTTLPSHAEGEEPQLFKAPEFTHSDESAWINSKPLKLTDLKGKVVLLDVWTFGCWNCYRSFPWMTDLEKRLQDEDFTVVGVHSRSLNMSMIVSGWWKRQRSLVCIIR